MEFFVGGVDDEYNRCLFDVSVSDLETTLRFEINDKITPNFFDIRDSLHLIGCERLLLMDNGKVQAAIYHPTEQRVKLLPPSAIRVSKKKCESRGLRAFSKFNCSGFGKDYRTGDIRVIRNIIIDYFEDGDVADLTTGFKKNRFEIYSLASDSWREIKADLPDTARLLPGRSVSVLVDDVYYWLATSLRLPRTSFGIVGFNFTTEEFKMWPLPPHPIVDDSHRLKLAKLGDGQLGLISYSGISNPIQEYNIFTVREGNFERIDHFTLPPPKVDDKVERVVETVVGFGRGRFLFLEKKLPNRNLYRLSVFDVPNRSLIPLDIYSIRCYMAVAFYDHGEARLPGASPLSKFNMDSDEWRKKIAELEAEIEEKLLTGRARHYVEKCGGSHGDGDGDCDGDGDGDGHDDGDASDDNGSGYGGGDGDDGDGGYGYGGGDGGHYGDIAANLYSAQNIS